jgi:hypothetical protein
MPTGSLVGTKKRGPRLPPALPETPHEGSALCLYQSCLVACQFLQFFLPLSLLDLG